MLFQLFSVVFIVLHLFPSSQPLVDASRLIDSCSTDDNYTDGSIFQSNLQTLLSSLQITAINSGGFSNITIGDPMSPGRVSGVLMCYGDSTPDECEACINTTVTNMTTACPYSKKASVIDNRCYLRYSNENFLGILTSDQNYYDYWDAHASNQMSFNKTLYKLVDKLIQDASKTPFLYATGYSDVSGSNDTVYVLIQCRWDLSAEDCNQAIAGALQYTQMFRSIRQSAVVYLTTCYLRYSVYPFVVTIPDVMRQSSPPPSSPLPSSSGSHPETKLTIIVVSTCLTFILIFGFSMWLWRRRETTYNFSRVENQQLVLEQGTRGEMARGRNPPRTPAPPVEGEEGGDPVRNPVRDEGEEGGDPPRGPARGDGTTSTHAALKSMAKSFSIPIQYPMLSESNYGIWAVKMKIVLRSLGVWSVIEGGDDDEDKDQGAMVAISQAVPDNVMMAIAEKQTAKEAWDAIKEMRIGEDRVKKARVQVLKGQLNKLQMEDSKTVNDFSMKLTTVVGEIQSLGTTLDDSEVVEKLFSSVPDIFLHIIGAIEQFGDVEKMTVSEAIGRLRTFEEGLKGREHSKGSGDQLLHTQAEWEAKCAKGKKVDGISSGVKKGGRNGRCRECGRGQGGGQGNKGDDSEDEQKPWKFDVSKVKCYNCNEYGHFAKEYPEPNKREKANLIVNNGDEEPALLLAEISEFDHTTPSAEETLQEGDLEFIGFPKGDMERMKFQELSKKVGMLEIKGEQQT